VEKNMGKVVIRCKKCGNDTWIENTSQKTPYSKVCSVCGAVYCAKNRVWVYEEN
jgi:ribosomal protein L37E